MRSIWIFSGKSRSRLRQVPALVLGLFLGISILPYFLAGEVYDYNDTMDGVRLPEVDAIVCLAGGRGRIAAAGDLWYRYWEANHRLREPGGPPPPKVPFLYISGMGPQATYAVFRRQLRAGVREVIPPEYVILERESFNTEANARWLSRYILRQELSNGAGTFRPPYRPTSGGQGGASIGDRRLPSTVLSEPRLLLPDSPWRRVVLVTSPYHMRRSALIFQKVFQAAGLAMQIQTLSAFQEPFEPGEWRASLHGTHVTMLEYLKWVYYRLFWKPSAD
ncbi:MAG: YdcF family protein [Oligoflexia bacterium]|nr:YdcF family protein [Oligoflexia bacterium]